MSIVLHKKLLYTKVLCSLIDASWGKVQLKVQIMHILFYLYIYIFFFLPVGVEQSDSLWEQTVIV